MIFWGKVLYLVEAGLPEEEKNLILRYSKEQIEWAQNHEFEIWKYLIDEEMLFNTDEKLIANMISPGPFTIGLPDKGDKIV